MAELTRSNLRVLVTRAPEQGSELAEALRALGLEPVLIPAIELAPPASFAALDAALGRLGEFHWLLFTSANAVEAFGTRRMATTGRGEWPTTPRVRVAAIGPATARALEKLGLAADLLPPQAVAESLTAAMLPYARQSGGEPTRFLLVRAEEAREHLPETLRAAGAEVTVAPAYRTVIPASSIELVQSLFGGSAGTTPAPSPPVRAITFTSSSTARNLLALCEAAGVVLPAEALRISIGPITSRTLQELGIPAHAEAEEATVAALAKATVTKLLSLVAASAPAGNF